MRDYIFFADDRGGIPTSTMHLADQIAKTHRVFWINTYTRLPKLSEFSKALKILTKRRSQQAEKIKREQSPAIISATPFQCPYFALLFRKLNGFFGGRFFKRFLEEHQIQSPVLVTNFPCVVDTFRNIRQMYPHFPQIYYCFDDFIEYPGFNPKHWQAMEDALLAEVDGNVFTSQDLVQKKGNAHKPQLYLPHGVDYEHFSRTDGTKKIETLEKINKPIVGFFGGLSPRWFDVETFIDLAKRFPQYSVVVIGPSENSTEMFAGIDNLHYLGRISYAEIPHYAQYFDVALMPFAKNGLTQAANPLKLYEYFALGLPIISAPLPSLANVCGPIYFANTHEEFGDQLEIILKSDLTKSKTEAQEMAKQNSWSARAEELMKFAETIK